MKTYSSAPDVQECLDRMQGKHHEDLDGVRVVALFVFDDEESSAQVLRHQGYAAQAVTRIIPLRERVLTVVDALIVVDRAVWMSLSYLQRDALVDHELTHLQRVEDEEIEGNFLCDSLGRPKLCMRQHDHQFGWFDDVAQRHGDASPEVCQAKALIASTGQLYFDFERKAA